MLRVGVVKEIWRYPVKSMAGERVVMGDLTPRGLRGDRRWALRDDVHQEIWSGRNLHAISACAARYLAEPAGDESPAVRITLPGGVQVDSGDTDAHVRISAALGHPLSLWPVVDPTNLAHYRRKPREQVELGAYLAEQFARLPGEPFPDLSKAPPEAMEFVSAPGGYCDVAPLHVLTTASLAHMKALNSAADWDVRRFRPNLLIETDGGLTGLVDAAWAGRTLAIADARVTCSIDAFRCATPTLATPDLPKDPSVLRSIVRDANQNLGLYAGTAKGGGYGKVMWFI